MLGSLEWRWLCSVIARQGKEAALLLCAELGSLQWRWLCIVIAWQGREAALLLCAELGCRAGVCQACPLAMGVSLKF